MIRAIFFDMNGVIENSESIRKDLVQLSALVSLKAQIYSNEKIAFARAKVLHDFLNNDFGEFPYEYHPLFWRELIKDRYGRFSQNSVSRVYNIFINEYLKKTSMYPDVLPLLLSLKGQYSLGVIANGNPIRCYKFLKKFKIINLFTIVLISEETGFKKPEPFLFEFALKRLKCEASESLMVGDRYDTDIRGAKKVGIHTVRIDRGVLKDSAPADEVEIPEFEIKELKELFSVLSDLNKQQGKQG